MNKNIPTANKSSAMIMNENNNSIRFYDLAEKILSDFPKRSQEIIKKRFGLHDEKKYTLERIGREYSITRERVRQIITDVIKHIRKKSTSEHFKKAEEMIIFAINKNHGIIRENFVDIEMDAEDQRDRNAVHFFVSCSEKIQSVNEKGIVEKAWVMSGDVISNVIKVHRSASEILEKKGRTHDEEILLKAISGNIPELNTEQILSYLKVLEKVKKNKLGKWGMSHWTEVNPKGTREKVHLVLKNAGKPMHFNDIALLIDSHGLSKKKAHPQTVHNELIKDNRFVLIGRGIYAMREWGYQEGTIKDVIQDILKESQAPMKKEEILKKVMKARKVKKSTVMINLNNSKYFEKDGALYSLKK